MTPEHSQDAATSFGCCQWLFLSFQGVGLIFSRAKGPMLCTLCIHVAILACDLLEGTVLVKAVATEHQHGCE